MNEHFRDDPARAFRAQTGSRMNSARKYPHEPWRANIGDRASPIFVPS
jgi:hypothetical protein